MKKKTLSLILLLTCVAANSFAQTTYSGKPWSGTAFAFTADNAANLSEANRVPAWKYDIGKVLVPEEGSTTAISATTFAGDLSAVAAIAAMHVKSVTAEDIRGTQATAGGVTLDATDNTSRGTYGAFLWNSVRSVFDKGGAATRYTCKFDAGKYKFISRAYGTTNSNFAYTIVIRDKATFASIAELKDIRNYVDLEFCSTIADKTGIVDATFPYIDKFAATTDNNIRWSLFAQEINIPTTGEYVVEFFHNKTPALGGVLGEFTFEYVGAYDGTGITNVSTNTPVISFDAGNAQVKGANTIIVSDAIGRINEYQSNGSAMTIRLHKGMNIILARSDKQTVNKKVWVK